MKKIAALLTLVLLLLLNDLKAQNSGNTQPKNELGVSVFGVLNRYKRSLDIYQQHWFNGIMYKRHFGKNAIRVGVEYFTEKESYNQEVMYRTQSGSYKFYSLEYRVGYQRTFPIRKFVVYLS